MTVVNDTLRDRQKQMARELILEATAELIVEQGLERLSLADVATRAGVSKRTLYNYFDSREMLLSELGALSEARTIADGAAMRPEGLDTLPRLVRALWSTWHDHHVLHTAAGMIEAASTDSGVSDGRRTRRSALAAAVQQVRPELTDEQADAIAALIHAFVSAPTFSRLTAEDGLDIDLATDLIAWALTVLREALERNDHPFIEEDDP